MRAAKSHLVSRYGTADPGSISSRPPVLKTVATGNSGVEDVVLGILQRRVFLAESGRWQSRLRHDAEERVRQLVCVLAGRHLFASPRSSGALEELLEAVASRRIDPYAAAEKVLGGARHLPT